MKKYQFNIKSQCITKGYWDQTMDNEKIELSSLNLEGAINELVEILKNDYGYEITKNALKHKNPIYRDMKEGTKQVGFIIIGHTIAENTKLNKWSKIVSELWIDIKVYEYYNFE